MKKEHKAPSGGKGHGVTGEAMKKYGRNLARAMNQKKHGGQRNG
jgi:hypothetical protein